MAYTIEPLWRTIWAREQHERELAAVGTVDWDVLLEMAYDYMAARMTAMQLPKGLYFGSNVDKERYTAYLREDHTANALWCACRMVHVPFGAVVNAARIANRYYDHGCTRILDAEALIRSLV